MTSSTSSSSPSDSTPEDAPKKKKPRTSSNDDAEIEVVNELPPAKPHPLSDATMEDVEVSVEAVNSLKKKPKGQNAYTKLLSINGIPVLEITQDSLQKFGKANDIAGYRRAKKKGLADKIAEEKVNPVVKKVQRKLHTVNRMRYVTICLFIIIKSNNIS